MCSKMDLSDSSIEKTVRYCRHGERDAGADGNHVGPHRLRAAHRRQAAGLRSGGDGQPPHHHGGGCHVASDLFLAGLLDAGYLS